MQAPSPQQPTYAQQPATTAYAQPAAVAAPVAPAPAAAPMAATTQTVAVTAGGEFSWLAPGEVISKKVTGLLGFSSPNPILRIVMALMTLIMAICGFRMKATFIVTNQRVVLDTRSFSLWILENGSDTTTITKASSITTGYNSSFFIFKKRYIAVDAMMIGVKRSYSQTELEDMAALIKNHL